MESESFEDKETAELINRSVVSIKVDREERPDIDSIYMMVCQMVTGSGGWPLSVFMTPDKKPFYAGTYFPKESRYGRIGFKELITGISESWKLKREEIVNGAGELTKHLSELYTLNKPKSIEVKILEEAFINFDKRFDAENGGFGTAPKFPSPHNLMFLLRYWKRSGNNKALEMAVKTLTEMRNGGIYDQIGFGFHRYSTDSNWLVPHFEKMLYDQALLLMAYTEAFQITGLELFKKTAEEIIIYLLRDMRDPEGGFYSAEDADSEGIEGKFYVWTEDELYELLGEEDAEFAFKEFNTRSDGNFKEEATRELTGLNILHIREGTSSKSIDDIRKEKIHVKMFEHRERRIHPYKDDKVLTDWNGLVIAALAKAGRVFDNREYISAAEQAIEFINKNLTSADGRLLHRYRTGESGLTANIDDYAFVVFALLELYESTFQTVYLNRAIKLTEICLVHFWDEKGGGFFFTPDYGEQLIVRTKEYYDGAIPSGNSVFAQNLLRLARITAESKYEDFARNIFDSASLILANNPQAFTQLLSAFDFSFGPGYEIIIAGDSGSDSTKKMINEISRRFIPNKVVILKDEDNPQMNPLFDYLTSYSKVKSQTAFYVCKNFVCNMPTTKIEDALKLLE